MIPPEYLDQIVTGDARVLAERIPDESIDLFLTDPPFGIGFKYSNGYRDDPAEYLPLVRWIVETSERVTKPGGFCFVFQASPRLKETWPLFPAESRLFVAAKNFVQMQGDVPYAYDPVIFWRRLGGGKLDWEREARDYHVGNTSPGSYARGPSSVPWHSCPRPLDTIRYLVAGFCPPRGIVLDLFMGSGTTAVAARLESRHWLGFEIDPDTAERARERVANTQPPIPELLVEQMPLEVSL